MTLLTGFVRLLTICSAAAGAFAASADVVPWLYHAEVQVRSQSAAERQRAGRAALAEVLRRVTGMAELPAHPALAAALREPDSFYSRYEFVRRAVAADAAAEDAEAVPQAGQAPAGAIRLRDETSLAIQFEPGAVLGLLRRANLPVWAANRPVVQAWVAVQREGQRELMAASADAVAQALAGRSRQRGLELSLPLMDLADRSLAASDVWGLFWEQIERVSGRYGGDLLLIGRLRQEDDGSWTGDWRLRSRAGAPQRLYDPIGAFAAPAGQAIDMAFQRGAESAAAAAAAAFDDVADALADRFAVYGDLDAVAVLVRGIDTVAGYAALLRYLHSREYVERLEINAVRPDALLLRMHSRSRPEQLRELLVMGGELAGPAASKTPGGALELTWRGGE